MDLCWPCEFQFAVIWKAFLLSRLLSLRTFFVVFFFIHSKDFAPSVHFTILGPQNPALDTYCAVHKHQSRDF